MNNNNILHDDLIFDFDGDTSPVPSLPLSTALCVCDDANELLDDTKRGRGRPVGSPNKAKPKVTPQISHKIKTLEEFRYAVLDLLWRSETPLTAKEIVSQITVTSKITERQLYKRLNSWVDNRTDLEIGVQYAERNSNGQTPSKKYSEWKYFYAKTKRTGWYWRGHIWSVKSLSEHSFCLVDRTNLGRRLHRGMGVNDAMRTNRTDNTRGVR